jgi:hypothetical protein
MPQSALDSCKEAGFALGAGMGLYGPLAYGVSVRRWLPTWFLPGTLNGAIFMPVFFSKVVANHGRNPWQTCENGYHSFGSFRQ